MLRNAGAPGRLSYPGNVVLNFRSKKLISPNKRLLSARLNAALIVEWFCEVLVDLRYKCDP
jgi:hypothetical protein